jgi:hypothetical protein
VAKVFISGKLVHPLPPASLPRATGGTLARRRQPPPYSSFSPHRHRERADGEVAWRRWRRGPLLPPVCWSRRGPDQASSGGARARGVVVFGVGRCGGGRGDSRRCSGGLRRRGGLREDGGLGRLRAALGFSVGAWGSPAALGDLDSGGVAPGGRHGCSAAEVASRLASPDLGPSGLNLGMRARLELMTAGEPVVGCVHLGGCWSCGGLDWRITVIREGGAPHRRRMWRGLGRPINTWTVAGGAGPAWVSGAPGTPGSPPPGHEWLGYRI